MNKSNSCYAVKTKLREMIFPAYLAGEIDLASAVARLNISTRQLYRLQSRYLLDKTLTHKLCNRVSNHSIDSSVKAKIIELYQTKYHGWNYEHIHDALSLRDGI